MLEELPVELCVGNILDPKSLKPALEDVTYVFHAAAQSAYWRDPDSVTQTSIDGTRNVLKAALDAGAKRVILTSSLAAMGVPDNSTPLTEENIFNLPPNKFRYGYSKYQAEQEALRFLHQGLDVVILNPSIVLGAGDVNQIGGSMVTEAARGWGFFYTGGGTNYVHIDDVVAGHVAGLKRGVSGERYILGGENLTYYDAITTINEVVGRKPPWLKVPVWITEPGAYLADWSRPFLHLPFDSNHLRMSHYDVFCDAAKARLELGVSATKSFRQAVEETYEWYLSHGVI
jgi:dihydroflavonol-4-reductase